MAFIKFDRPSWNFYLSQWSRLPPMPDPAVFKGKTIILTGANSGIGLEAAKDLAAAGPAKLILAVRTLSSGEMAIKNMRKEHSDLVAEAWELELGRYESVIEFGKRASELDHVDYAFLNAGVNPGNAESPLRRTVDGHDAVVQTNVYGTILLALLLAPVLRKSAQPKLVFTSSEVHAWANYTPVLQCVKTNTSIMAAFDDADKYVNAERYFQSKLVIRHLIPALPDITITSANPGLCFTNLGRDFKLSFAQLGTIFMYLTMGRSAHDGAQSILLASQTSDSHEFVHLGEPEYAPSVFMASRKGNIAAQRFWDEVKAELERAAPGCTLQLSGEAVYPL